MVSFLSAMFLCSTGWRIFISALSDIGRNNVLLVRRLTRKSKGF